MATIIKRKKNYSVVYYYENESGEKNWSLNTYDGNLSLISNYINPIIGSVPIQNVNRKFVDQYYNTLKKQSR